MAAATTEHEVAVTAGDITLPGTLALPQRPQGTVVFAHGSGSSRLSSRNVAVSRTLVEKGCATLLFDLLTEEEAGDRRNVFDIALLGRRVLDATAWLRGRVDVRGLPVGYFGASTGAAAALVAAADLGEGVAAVVSRGGRPDLAGEALPLVTAPTLLLVGSLDVEVLRLNESAARRLRAPCTLQVIPGATHLFEEPGTLQEVAEAAAAWFVRHFGGFRGGA
jgi:putative phosphoribosyl transferase